MTVPDLVVVLVICGAVAAVIARSKNTPVLQAIFVGTLLGPIGVFFVAMSKRGRPAAPPGMRSVKCPRCNAVQNVYDSQQGFQCWQCQQTTNLR